MHGFTDRHGRSWEITIDVAAVKRVRGLLGIDLYGLIDNQAKGLSDLLSDPVRLVDTLYLLCKDQADKADVSDEDFGRGFSGDSLAAASEAFVEELIDFFPESKARASLRLMIARGKELGAKVLAKATAELAAVDLESLATELIASSGNVPASLASTPAPSPSVN